MLNKLRIGFLAALVAAAATAALSQPPTAPFWSPPANAQVRVDKASGKITITMPREITTEEQLQAQFAQWKAEPFAGSGPTKSMREEDGGLPTHTLYHPRDLAAGPKLPIVLWANGGCRNTSIEHTHFLGELASHGYLVIAVGRLDVPYWTPAMNPVGAKGGPPLQVMGSQIMLDGLNWAARENARPASKYYQRLDLDHVVSLGQSCGGQQAWATTRDPRIKAVGAVNSSFPTRNGASVGPPPKDFKGTVETLKIPAAYFIGGPADVAYGPAEASYAATPASAQVVKVNKLETGHTGWFRQPDRQFEIFIVAWVDWQMKAFEHGKINFVAPDCPLCKDPGVWLETKNVH